MKITPVGHYARLAVQARDAVQADATHLRVVGLSVIAFRLHDEANKAWDAADQLYQRALSLEAENTRAVAALKRAVAELRTIAKQRRKKK